MGINSGFYLADQVLRPKTKPDDEFRLSSTELFCRTNQVLTGHSYTGEYYARMNIPNPICCSCDPSVLSTRDHIIRSRPLYDRARLSLERRYPHLQNPRFSLGSLLRRKTDLPEFMIWLRRSGAFTKKGIPWDTTPWQPPWLPLAPSPVPSISPTDCVAVPSRRTNPLLQTSYVTFLSPFYR